MRSVGEFSFVIFAGLGFVIRMMIGVLLVGSGFVKRRMLGGIIEKMSELILNVENRNFRVSKRALLILRVAIVSKVKNPYQFSKKIHRDSLSLRHIGRLITRLKKFDLILLEGGRLVPNIDLLIDNYDLLKHEKEKYKSRIKDDKECVDNLNFLMDYAQNKELFDLATGIFG